jgi:hypothetical protein
MDSGRYSAIPAMSFNLQLVFKNDRDADDNGPSMMSMMSMIPISNYDSFPP